jgi:hypothetical protein
MAFDLLLDTIVMFANANRSRSRIGLLVAVKTRGLLASSVASAFVLLATVSSAFAYVNVADFGAKGDGSDATSAIQAAINSTSGSGDTIYIPAGTYGVSSTITLSYVNGIRIVGDGLEATRLQPSNSMAGHPVIQIVDGMHDSVESLSILGSPGNPPSAGIESDSALGAEGTHLTLRDLTIGSDSAGSIVDGVKFDAPTNADYNNDMGFFENVVIRNFTHAGYAIMHSNSLVHTIVGGTIANGPIGVYAQAGSFKMMGTHFDNLTDVDFDLENPLSGQAYQHPIVIGDVSSQGSQTLMRTGTAILLVSITGLDASFTNPTAPLIAFNAVNGMLLMSNSYMYQSAGTTEVDFLGGKNQVVNLMNNYFGPSQVVLNGRMLSQANCWKSGTLRASRSSVVNEMSETCGKLHRTK